MSNNYDYRYWSDDEYWETQRRRAEERQEEEEYRMRLHQMEEDMWNQAEQEYIDANSLKMFDL